PVFSPLPLPPPRSTLFPYTTLFRSPSSAWPNGLSPGSANVLLIFLSKSARHEPVDRTAWAGAHEYRNPGGVARRASQYQAVTGTDRKSTRLNSSHDQISYAVFCLKK